MIQLASALLMVRPARFGYNSQITDNSFSRADRPYDPAAAVAEFEGVVTALTGLGLKLLVLDDRSASPDAVFPNNWFSLQPDGTLFLYPMTAPSRRTEVRPDIPERLKAFGCKVGQVIDWSGKADQNLFLEGTGSLVLDHVHKVAYAALSERTDPALVRQWCALTGYTPVCFEPVALPGPDGKAHRIYHTNVLMAIGEGFAVLCPEAISSGGEAVLERLRSDDLEIIELSLAQLMAFAGNMLQVMSAQGPCLLMSESARLSLSADQLARLRRHTRLAAMPIPTLEAIGGGSLRCMLAEIGCVQVGT